MRIVKCKIIIFFRIKNIFGLIIFFEHYIMLMYSTLDVDIFWKM